MKQVELPGEWAVEGRCGRYSIGYWCVLVVDLVDARAWKAEVTARPAPDAGGR